MSFPHFGDVGKSANDLINKDFPHGKFNLELKTNTSNGVLFTVVRNQDLKKDASTAHSELKTKYTDRPNGLVFTQSWNTHNVLGSKLELDNRVAKGVKLEVNAGFSPSTSHKSGKVTLEYKQLGLHTRSHVDLFKGPIFSSDATIGRDGWVFGSEVGYDVQDARVTKYGAVAGYQCKEFTLAMHAFNNLNSMSASYYHRLTPDLEVAGKGSWDLSAKNGGAVATSLDVAAKLRLDKDATVKAKLSHLGQLGLAYAQNLRPGVKLTLAGLFDTAKLNETAPKFGLSLVFEN